MKHELKVWPEFFAALRSGAKTFEARKNDRNFKVGDMLDLREWAPLSEGNGYYTTSLPLLMRVTYVLRGPAFGVEAGFVVMAVSAP